MCIEDIEKYAKENNVPIMEKEGIEYLTKYIIDNNIKTILEIGSAIGYSAIRMASISNDIKITTIERDESRYNLALNNIKQFNLDNQIDIILGDALLVDIKGSYDLIFIDAAKAQSIKFFEKYEVNLSEKGTIITDNINFHGLTFNNSTKESRNVRQLVRKINTYLEWLKDNKNYQSNYVDIGDGLMVSKKNN